MNEINRVVSAISAVHSVQSSNEWEPRSCGGRWPSRVSPVNGSLQDLTHLKDVLLHCPELHCLVKFIWNNGDLELLPHICVTAREGTIGFYMEHWFIPQLLSRTCEVTEQGISSSWKVIQLSNIIPLIPTGLSVSLCNYITSSLTLSNILRQSPL